MPDCGRKISCFRGSTRKYRNKKMMCDGIMFDSKHEAQRYVYLSMMQRDGYISNLRCQVKYELIPAQYEETDAVYSKGARKGQRKQGKMIEKSCVYIADFVYKDEETGRTVVEDAKGVKTKDYIIKRKLMLWLHGIRIAEV